METELRPRTKPFARADTTRSVAELCVGVLGLSIAVIGLFITYTYELWLAYIPLVIVASLFMVKLFTLFHDCAHNSMFTHDALNTWVGRFLSIIIVTPFTQWKLEHADHHNHVSDMEKIRFGDVPLFTVAEYRTAPRWKQTSYRIFRHPLFLIIVAPFLYFFVKGRLPNMHWKKQCMASVFLTNVCIGILYLPILFFAGFWTFIFVFALPAYLGGILGMTLFYLQHDYPGSHWYQTKDWDHERASLSGSSLITLPQPFEWFTHTIGYHHVHHINNKIPGYRLKECFDHVPALQKTLPLTLRDMYNAFALKLWSYEKNALIRFSEYPCVQS